MSPTTGQPLVARVEPAGRVLGWVLLVGGLIGAAGSMALTIEKFRLLSDPFYVPLCTVDAVLSCTAVMMSDQAGVFGFPNPLIGIATFPVLAALGALLLSGLTLPRWVWGVLQVGVSFGIVFVGWLISQTLYQIGALCPYCMVVWAAMIPIFWAVTVRNLTAGVFGVAAADSPVVRTLASWQWVLILASYLVVITLVGIRFADHWASMF